MSSHLTLSIMVGPVLPVPLPRAAIDELTAVEVTRTAERGKPGGFRLTFNLSKRSPLHTIFLLAGGALPPVMRTLIVATIGGTPHVLMDGVITKQDVTPGTDAAHDVLDITGVDLTAVMGLVDQSGVPYPAMPIEARVAVVLAKYAVFGVVPQVVPTILFEAPIPTAQIPRQKGTDLEYLNALAELTGYVFCLDPGPAPGMNTAYFGPETKLGPPQPALSVNLDAHSNVETLTFSLDTEQKKMPVTIIQDLLTKVPIPIPIPDISPLNPLLGAVPLPAKKVEFVTDGAKRSPIQAALHAMAQAAASADAVKGSGTLDVLRYGRPLRARALVGVRGAGPAFDGLHFVQQVTHKIKRGEYKQEFKLTRNGLLPTLPRVPV
ncbi:hypothetical protein GCM10009555_058360 [Acrocarpospora macrocephala]|uniref:Uncharacterized protein n=1 Tax=Acrocarpospora macrocephala TaxID=150177 RepID=A0A5M3WVC3_9ACTN|nr:hypothetical protein [Acrocarpospora macrocephala]GES11939.1 hypothetical protein Amac_055360 [Acrocarpospora macrocephala]